MARMPLLRLLSLAVRQLLRDARAGELRVLFFALLVAVAASTAIGYFGARLNGAVPLNSWAPTWSSMAPPRPGTNRFVSARNWASSMRGSWSSPA